MNDCRYWPFCSYFKSHGCAVRKCEHYKRMPDRVALLMLADEIHRLVENQQIRFFHVVQVHESTLATIEARIREACGEVVE